MPERFGEEDAICAFDRGFMAGADAGQQPGGWRGKMGAIAVSSRIVCVRAAAAAKMPSASSARPLVVIYAAGTPRRSASSLARRATSAPHSWMRTPIALEVVVILFFLSPRRLRV
jgi:hypothetical protein